jgi:hypothetical protein
MTNEDAGELKFWPDPAIAPADVELGIDGTPTRDYRGFVSHASQYGVLALAQFEFMCRLGLKEDSTLLDIGCGSLRGGRLFIPYLLPGRYFGIEPVLWPIEEGLEHELGMSALQAKAPLFLLDENYTCTAFGRSFDFLLAQSIFSHAPVWEIRRCMEQAAACMTETSIFAATYVKGDTDSLVSGWENPESIAYTPLLMEKLAAESGLHCFEYEPHSFGGQTWVLLVKDPAVVKPRVQAICIDPAGSARGGDQVRITVMVQAFAQDLTSVEIFANGNPFGESSGEWVPVASLATQGRNSTVTTDWSPQALEAGVHRIGVNLHAGTQSALWYDHPVLTYRIV